MPGWSPCGRTNKRIRGWLGRADQTTKVRGMFVHPEQIALVLDQFPQISKARLVVSGSTGQDVMTFKVERSDSLDADAISASVRDHTKLRAKVEFVEPGELPNDGKVIEDIRSYE